MMWTCKSFATAFIFRAHFLYSANLFLWTQAISVQLSHYYDSQTPSMKLVSFLTEHVLIDSSTNEKSFTVSRAARFWQRCCLSLRQVCVCMCVEMALKADLMLGLRHQKHNSDAVSLKNSLHHFIWCKNLYLVVVLFLHVFTEGQTNRTNLNVL